MGTVQLNPTIKVNPWDVYQRQLESYRAQNPAMTAATMPKAPSGPGLGGLVGLVAAKKGLDSAVGSGAAEAASAPAVDLATMESLSTGGNGLQSVAPLSGQMSTAPASGMGLLPIAGGATTALSALAAAKAIKDKNPLMAGLAGLGGGLGVNMMGWGIGGPLAWAGLAAAPAGLALLNKFLDHKSTKEYQNERWGAIGKSANAPTANYAAKYLEYLKSPQAKTDAQYENTFAGKKAAGTLKPQDVWGSLGVMKTFGDDWFGKYTTDQRTAISQALLDKNLFSSDKGDTVIKDAAAAKTAADEVLKKAVKK